MSFAADLFQKTLLSGGRELGLELPRPAVEKMTQFARIMLEANRNLNLTRVVEVQEVAVKHFLDSLSCLLLPWPSRLICLDMGTGAGFPGIPLAIMRPEWSFVLLDSVAKRLQFLEQACAQLAIANVGIEQARAEEAGRDVKQRERYDLVVSRGVARLPVLLELSLPLVRPEGKFVAFKALAGMEELAESSKALAELKGILERTFSLQLPYGMGIRHLFVFGKLGRTPGKYPRRVGIPGKRPLV